MHGKPQSTPPNALCRVASALKSFASVSTLWALMAFIVGLALLMPAAHAANNLPKAGPITIKSAGYSYHAHAFLLQANPGQTFAAQPKVNRTSPTQLVIELPNTSLKSQVAHIHSIVNDGIDRIELVESAGVNPSSKTLQVIVQAQNPAALDGLTLNPAKQTLAITLPNAASITGNRSPLAQAAPKSRLSELPSPLALLGYNLPESKPLGGINGGLSLPGTKTATATAPVKVPSAPSLSSLNKTLVISITPTSQGIVMKSAQNKPILVKSQFILKDPKRVVVDLADTVLAEKTLSQTIALPNAGAMRSIRVAQFDESTVRLVIDTDQPKRIALFYANPADKSALSLVSDTGMASPKAIASAVPQANGVPTVTGIIDDIKVDKLSDATRITIKATQPLQQHQVRQGDTLQINIPNMVTSSASVNYDPSDFPAIKGLRVRSQPGLLGTTLDIDLQQALDATSQSSADGKQLSIILFPRGTSTASWMNPGKSSPEVPVSGARADGKFTVVVDAGHGGKDVGANRAGIYEKDMTLAVATKLKRALEAKGVHVVMTRSSDMFLELSQITGITNKVRPDAFVSVHINSSVKPTLTGIETYYYKPQSLPLAKSVHKQMMARVSGSPDNGVRKAMYYVIHHTEVPAILCEIGYISNESERNAMLTDTRQSATAEAISTGVVQFLNQRLKAQAPAKAPAAVTASQPVVAPSAVTSMRIELPDTIN